jgi:L-cysteine/cystine lyase
VAGIDKHSVRRELPATASTVYLNNGTYGPLPRRSADAISAALTRELDFGRIGGGMQSFLDYREELSALRAVLAHLVGARADEIALARSTTEGVNLGLWGRSWAAGDEVVTSSQEHGGVLMPLAMLRQRYGVKITFAEVGHGDAAQTLDAFEKAIHPGVKMVALSHVLYTTGATVPLKEITAMAHAAGSIVHVDGAQSVGALPVDVDDLGIDYYAFPGQKWLCGPDSSGGFFVRSDQVQALSPTFTTFSTIDFRQFSATDPDSFVLSSGASRFETGTFFRPAVKGFAASLQWLTEVVGVDDAISDIGLLSAYCRDRVGEIPGVTVLTPSNQLAGLVSFQIGDADVDQAVSFLAGAGISIRSIHENHALRISTGFYNTTEEIDLAVQKIWEFMRQQAG